MNKNEVLPYVYDFVRILVDKIGDEAKGIILFGSVARGNPDPESDVDVFVNVPERKAKVMQGVANKAVNEFEVYALRSWKLKGMNLPIRCIVGDINSKRWSALKREMISSGIVLYGNYMELPEGLKPRFIFSFTLARLKHNKRVSFVRKLYGHSTKVGLKTYAQKGILQKLGGEKLNPGIVLVPSESYREMHEFFKNGGATFKIREVWME